jgi:hypothetical protein
MKKGKIIFAFISIAMLLTITGAMAAVPVRTSGVSNGDTFTYGNANFSWNSDDPTATPPTEWNAMNGTAYFRVTIESIVGTNVTISSLAHYNNGTETTQSGWVDVDTGDGNMTFFLISANLNANDSIYSGSDYSTYTINETIPGTRATDHLNATTETSVELYSIYLSMNFYWDKTTGVLTKMSMTSNETTTYTTNWSVSFELTSSNKFTVPEYIGLPQILLLLASLTLITLTYRRKLHRPQNH